MKEKLLTLLQEILPSGYRIKSLSIHLGLKIVSISFIFIIYFGIYRVLPKGLEYNFEISMIASLVILVIVALPVLEIIEVNFKKKFLSEYLVDDPLTLKSAYKRFDKSALITRVFPDMVKISGSKAGRICIHGETSGSFEVYSFAEGKRRKIKSNSIQINERLVNFLKDKKQGITIADSQANPEINEDFLSLKADFILPFIYRERLFGFLTLSGIPPREELPNMMLLAGKSALAVYNHILSSQVAVHQKYKRELEIANRIEDLIFTTRIPDFKEFVFESLQKEPTVLLEFFKNDEEEYIFILLALSSTKVGSGLVSSHMLGKFYSQTLLKKKHNMQSIKAIVEDTLKKLSWEEGYEMLLGTFKDVEPKLTLLMTGKNFKITNDSNQNNSLISLGWRYTIDLNKNSKIYIYYKNDKVASINCKNS